jgi:hypothetical protein
MLRRHAHIQKPPVLLPQHCANHSMTLHCILPLLLIAGLAQVFLVYPDKVVVMVMVVVIVVVTLPAVERVV